MIMRLLRGAWPLRPCATLRAVMALVVAGLIGGSASTRAEGVSDLELKAAFLFNFAQFVEWPPESGPVVIGIAANTALTAAVATTVRGRLIRGRALEARLLAAGDSTAGSHVVFIGDLSPDDASALLSRVYGPVLTVGETTRALRDGSIVRIFMEDRRMRFQINRKQAQASGVPISSRALLLAAK
jgi:hypothetical protein